LVIAPAPPPPGEMPPLMTKPGALMLVLPAITPLDATVMTLETERLAAFSSKAGPLLPAAPMAKVETFVNWPGLALVPCKFSVPVVRLMVEMPPPP